MVGIGRDQPDQGPRRGDIHFVALADLGGHILRGPHPAVIVQADRMRRSSTTLIAPMTSAPRSAELRPPYLVAVAARESGLSKDGWVKCDQVLTVPAAVLGPRVGRLSPDRLAEVDAALRFVLDLP